MILIFKTNDEQFYLQKRISDTYYISVTNLKLLWSRSFTKDEILQLFKSSNGVLRRSSDDILLEMTQSLLSGKGPEATVVKNGNIIVLTLSEMFESKVKTRLTVSLDVQSPEKFYEEVTNPLIVLLNGLKDQRNELCELIKAKDVELGEYKLEGAEISRINVVTDAFQEDSYLKERSDGVIRRWRLNEECQLSLSPDLSKIFAEVSRPRDSIVEVKSEPETDTLLISRSNSRVKNSKRKQKLSVITPAGGDPDASSSKPNIGADVPRSKVTKKAYLL